MFNLSVGVLLPATLYLGSPVVLLQPPAAFQASAIARAPESNNYSDGRSWLCRPGRHDACDVDLTTTMITADGTLTREPWTPDSHPQIDCFYVYPTVSTDTTLNSDMVADAAELNVIRQQFARFRSKCRPYAPLYRQVTAAGVRRLIASGNLILNSGLAYDDVRDAWNYYLRHDNNGHGFVLVGHSQGATILAELIRREIDGKAIQSRMVTALLIGTNLAVPRDKDVGGAFQNVPLCHSPSQTGCVITYASFRSTVPPPANSLLGRILSGPGAGDPQMVAGCTNPAALGGGSGSLRAYFSADGRTITGTTSPKTWVAGRTIDTPWVSVPGLLTAKCQSNDYATYLEVNVHGDPSDPRTDDIGGDIEVNGQVQASWGLHLVDMHLAMGNLVDIVGRQGRAWLARQATRKQKSR